MTTDYSRPTRRAETRGFPPRDEVGYLPEKAEQEWKLMIIESDKRV
jgi:hypothetical protein